MVKAICKKVGSDLRKWSLYKMEIKETSSKFIKVRCTKCKNEQIIFEKAATEVRCLVCNEVLATPCGGKALIKANVLEVLN